MDLWIRSQDKEKLLKVDEMHLGLNKQYVDSNIWVNNFIVGEYATKERALEVLDEIQSKIATLNFQNHFIGTDFNIIESNIYQMPEK